MSNLATFGYELHTQVFTSGDINAMLTWIPSLEGAAGTRNLLEIPKCRELGRDTRITKLVEGDLGHNSIPIRAILFDKSAAANWKLGWHQDKKIAVKRRIETEGFSAWSEKEGIIHCQPPATILEASLAVRIHIDPCGHDNGPLRVIPGSHLAGFRGIGEDESEVTCTAESGDVLLMKPLTLHASSKAVSPRHRRVIHIEYCSASLPNGLEWAFS